MKRIISLILIVCLLIPLTGCGWNASQFPVTFYYRRTETAYGTDSGIIAPELRDIRSEGHLGSVLSVYLKGPISKDLESPFPRDTEILFWSLQHNTLRITMNETFGDMSGVELTIACACLAKTIFGMSEVDQIQIQAENTTLGGEPILSFSRTNVSLYDDSLNQSRADFTLYYSDRARRYLIAQNVSVSLATENDLVRFLVESLLTPPEDSGLISPLPVGTKLLDYSLDDGICTLNFSGEFEQNLWARCESQRLALLSVVNTLTQLDDIHQVEFCTDGNLLAQYGLISIPAPLVFEENAIGPVRTGMNEFDTTLYLSNGSGSYLAAVPMPLRQITGSSPAEQVVLALIQYQDLNGFHSTIPQQTRLLSVETRSGMCYVDLSGEFLSTQDHLVSSVRSIVSSVCALEQIHSVQITVDGIVPDGEFRNLFQILSPKPDWFL